MGMTTRIQYHRSAMGRPLPDADHDVELASVQGVQLALLTRVDGEFSTHVWKNVMISAWFGQSTLTGLAVYDRNMQPLYEHNPRGISTINLLVPGRYVIPNAETRREFQRFAQEYASLTAAAVIVLPGTGFISSAVRGVITALALASPRGPKMHVMDSTRAAAEWLPTVHSERTGVAISTDELMTLLESVERTLT